MCSCVWWRTVQNASTGCTIGHILFHVLFCWWGTTNWIYLNSLKNIHYIPKNIVNSGSFVSTAITPILREDVKCFDKDDCYSLAFGVPAILMAVSIMIFVFGKPLYKLTVPSGNMFAKVVKCIAVNFDNNSLKILNLLIFKMVF